MMRAVRIAGHARPDRPVLAVHGDAALQGAHGRIGVLRASLLFDDEGGALVSATQQLAFPDGWWSSCGAMAQKGPSAVQALSMQIMDIKKNRSDWTIIHAFERGSQHLLRELSAARVSWISRVGGVTRVSHDGSLATVSAVAKTLTHYSVPDSPVRTISAGPDGSAPTDAVLWVAVTPIDRIVRNAVQTGVVLVSVKIVRRTDGRELKHVFGLAHIVDEQPSAAQLATWLVTGYEVRALFRAASRTWVASGAQSFGAADMPLKTLMAAQTALASWQLLSQPSVVSAMAARLAGTQRQSLSATGAALHKLFALKMWLNETAGAP